MYQVYVVEDDERILKDIVNTVPWLDNGFEVVGQQTSPLLAIEEILKLSPHVVFSDLKMPHMDGNEMIAKLKERGCASSFVMLSAFGTFQDSRTFFMQEGFDYILKPLQPDDVQIVLERLACRLASREEPQPQVYEGVSSSFRELTTYIAEHINEKYTLDSLGKQFGLHPNYICNLFAKQHNSTLTRFVTQLRMAEAVRLMKQPGIPFKEVAINCGFSDYYYFCKVFKEFYGMPPTQYRTEHFINP